MAGGQSISGRENSMCKGPEAESCSAPCSISKEARGPERSECAGRT